MKPPVRRERARIGTPHGIFTIVGYEFPSGREHVALLCGDPELDPAPLVRVQSACLTSTVFRSPLCDCATQVDMALRRIANEGRGCILYLDQEGRGHGLVEKVAHLRAINEDCDTVEAALKRGVQPDVREYEEAATILMDLLGSRPLRLLTNNPTKVLALEAVGVRVSERIQHETEPTDQNRTYLLTKKRKLGHLLNRV